MCVCVCGVEGREGMEVSEANLATHSPLDILSSPPPPVHSREEGPQWWMGGWTYMIFAEHCRAVHCELARNQSRQRRERSACEREGERERRWMHSVSRSAKLTFCCMSRTTSLI